MSDPASRLAAALADRYRIERELGAGGMATVYLAEDLKHDRKVALKVLKPELAAVLGAERFVVEIKTTAGLQHPHILPLFDSGSADGFLYYVMPYVEGETLRNKLDRETQLSIDEAVRITREVAEALDYAHRHGVIHRDIKPENILLHDGRPVVADFGIALAVSAAAGGRMTETGLSLGTPHYMSPEQATAEKELSSRSDIYSLGCVLYEMLTGSPPHVGATAQQIIMKIVTEEAAPVTRVRKSVPPHVAAAVAQAIERLPADRFASAKEFADALGNPGFAHASAGAKAAEPQPPWLKDRRSWLALGVAAAAIVAAILLGVRGAGSTGMDGISFAQLSFAPQAIFSARFAPDGKTIVYSAALEGNTPRLYLLRPDFPAASSIGPDSTLLLAISSKGEMAVLLGARHVAHRVFSGTLAQMPIGGDAPPELLTGVRQVDWAPDGSAMAIIHEVGGKDRLEYPVGKVLHESPGYLSDIRISPRGDAVALFEHPFRWDNRGAVILVDANGRRSVLSDGHDGLEGLAWSADGKSVLFSGSTHGEFRQVYSADPGGSVRMRLPTPGNATLHDASPSGRLLFTDDVEQDRVYVRAPGSNEDRNLSWLDRSQNPILSADGRVLVFTNASLDAGNNYATMFRRTDGSPAVRLGEGGAADVSTDGRWALSVIYSPPQLVLYPTGPGQARRLDKGEFQAISGARLFRDGHQFLACGNQPGQPPRCYVGSVDSGPLRPVTPEGTDQGFVSPDGREVVARLTAGGYRAYSLNGGDAREIPGLTPDDRVAGWAGTRALVVRKSGSIPMQLEHLELATGRRSRFLSVAPADRAGLLLIGGLAPGLDPRVYAYSTRLYISTLFAVEGMR